jgi:murein DD-endopeptidase MepM/ murein hydrolase activator NlpD
MMRVAPAPKCVRRGAILAAAIASAACGPPPAPADPAPRPSAAEPIPAATVVLSVADSARMALSGRRLLVPVAGVDVRRIPDSFSAPRGARTHGALDIMAPRGTPVLSADEGEVLRVSENRAGGLTVDATDDARRLVYYYAHMDRYAEGIAAGRRLARGDTIGFVGTTGNAPRDIPHLHFQMMLMHPEGRYWAGTPVNPLPFLLAHTTDADEPDE